MCMCIVCACICICMAYDAAVFIPFIRTFQNKDIKTCFDLSMMLLLFTWAASSSGCVSVNAYVCVCRSLGIFVHSNILPYNSCVRLGLVFCYPLCLRCKTLADNINRMEQKENRKNTEITLPTEVNKLHFVLHIRFEYIQRCQWVQMNLLCLPSKSVTLQISYTIFIKSVAFWC